MRDAQLGVLAVRHDVLGVQLAVGHHLRERDHRRRVGPDRIGRDHVDVGILGGLRRGDAAVDPDLLLLRHCGRHMSPRPYFQFSMSLSGRSARFLSSSACLPWSPGVIANAVSMRTTPVSKSISGTLSRQPVGHSSMQTRQPLQ